MLWVITREPPNLDLKSIRLESCTLGNHSCHRYFLQAYIGFSHRHVRFGLFFHSLALIQCLWNPIPNDQRKRYLSQVQLNQEYIRRWISPSPVNNGTWHALIVSCPFAGATPYSHSLTGSRAGFVPRQDGCFQTLRYCCQVSDTVGLSVMCSHPARLAMDNDWIMEEGWALYLEGCHFQRQGVEYVANDSLLWQS
jgi:hypothetical protein